MIFLRFVRSLVMLKLLLLVSLICICPLGSLGQRTDDLYISATLTRGERSRDSGGETTTITLTGDRLAYEQKYYGMAGGRHKPIIKEYKLSDEERRGLVKLINERHLLVTDTIEYPTANSGTRRYFAIAIQIKTKRKMGAISIKGPRNAVKIKDEKLYKDSAALIEELYRIINKRDEQITYGELID